VVFMEFKYVCCLFGHLFLILCYSDDVFI
jgi:hypothetical protein